MKNRRNKRESGQVLLTGLVMMLIILLAILLLFDVHSVIRAKYKVETANQAAALAAAEWQKESLNLLGEINLIKACETLLESEDHWPAVSPDPSLTPEEARAKLLRERIGLLTEMQVRVSFLGPLVGFAAAQQAAKQNGLTPVMNADNTLPLEDYVQLLQENWRYLQVSDVRNFKWRIPYLNMVSDIVSQGIVVYPNARVANNPIVKPGGLAKDALYQEIMRHRAEIAAADPPEQSDWHGVIYPFVRKMSDADYEGKWWNIDYSMSEFPHESEIFTLGVEYDSSDYDENTRATIQTLLGNRNAYSVTDLPPVQFCVYDKFWYPDYYRNNYTDYDDNHYSWWFEAGVLRQPVKPQYIYEGPAAYAESAANINLVSRYAVTGDRRSADVGRRFVRRRDPEGGGYSRRIGTRRASSANANLVETDYRPGAIAKVLGELGQGAPPITLPVILPVFDNTTLTPTYMPMPYGFGVLRVTNSPLDRFLNWLSREESLFAYGTSPPLGTSGYLEALQILTDGPGFRCYGWNPSWNASAFDSRYRSDAARLFTDRSYVYSRSNTGGAGWLQEAQEFTLTNSAEAGIQEVEDYVNGGTARRFFSSSNSRVYIVVDSKGHIVTNDEIDPTVHYFTGGGSGGSGPGFNGTQDRPDTQPGPPRI